MMSDWSRRRPRRREAALCRIADMLAIVTIIMPLLTGCGQGRMAEALSGTPEGPTIAIGVASDEPGLGYWHDGSYEGFDVEVAKYVAAKLGYANKQIIFKQVRPENRQSQLDEGNVDMVVASWLVTDQSRRQVNFAGPYLSAGIGVLVRAQDAEALARADDSSQLGDLSGRTVCAVAGDEFVEPFRDRQSTVAIQARDSYAQCVTALQVGSADAIVAGTALLAGLRAANDSQYFTMLKLDGRQDYGYGIAVRRDSPQLASDIDDALNDMVQDGSWAKAAETYTSITGFDLGQAGEAKKVAQDSDI